MATTREWEHLRAKAIASESAATSHVTFARATRRKCATCQMPSYLRSLALAVEVGELMALSLVESFLNSAAVQWLEARSSAATFNARLTRARLGCVSVHLLARRLIPKIVFRPGVFDESGRIPQIDNYEERSRPGRA